MSMRCIKNTSCHPSNSTSSEVFKYEILDTSLLCR